MFRPAPWRLFVHNTARFWSNPLRRPAANPYHGSLRVVTDSDLRALRPIGLSVYETATLTGTLLAELCGNPIVHIFQGVRGQGSDTPPVPHAVNAGRRTVLVESVHWPPGRYVMSSAGQIHCDGIYIGQSPNSLISAVEYWRGILPRTHTVSALVVVHSAAGGMLTLPRTIGPELAWVHAEQAIEHLRDWLLRHPTVPSRRTLAALAASTAVRERPPGLPEGNR